jgi:hypothetical protein
MSELRGWIIYSWIALPTVMYGGYALLRLITQANAATPFRLAWFRAGHPWHYGQMRAVTNFHWCGRGLAIKARPDDSPRNLFHTEISSRKFCVLTRVTNSLH